MKIIIAADKFKGSLTSFEVCNAILQGIKQVDENIVVQSFPMADGGDGFAKVMQHYTQTKTIECNTFDPLQRPMKAAYQWNAITKTAIIEMATASGLVLLQLHERNPMKTSSYGTGLLIKDAISKGAEKIILGIGGSATNDAGMGILRAMGFIFIDVHNKELTAAGENLSAIEKIIPPAGLPAVHFEIACDVQNVLYGAQGAAFVYAPQKGAAQEQVRLLDDGLRHFAEIIMRQTNYNVAETKGMGAAGGIAAGLSPFLKVVIEQGTQIIIEASNIKNSLAETGLIITGEGKIDNQSREGKLISSIAMLAKQYHIPVMALCGSLQLDNKAIKELGLDHAYSIMNASISIEYSMKNAAELLRNETARIISSLGKGFLPPAFGEGLG